NIGGTSFDGTATIKDDGTGTLFTDGSPSGDTPPTNPSGPFDDDRPLDDTDDGPDAVADTGTTTENLTLNITAANGLLSNDTDPDSTDVLTVSSVDGSAENLGVATSGSNGGSFNIAADGSYSFDPGTSFDDLAVGESQTTSISYSISDGEGGSSTNTVTITVTGTNDQPVIDLNGADKIDTGYTTAFATNQSTPVPITGLATSITDVDDTNIESARITLTNAKLGDALQLGSLPAGIGGTVDTNIESASITVSLSGSATKAAYQEALQAISFSNELNTPNTTSRTLDVLVNDGDGNSNTAVSTIQVIGISSLTAPDTKTVEGKQLSFQADLTAASESSDLTFTLTVASTSTATPTADYTSTPTFTNGVTWVNNDPTTGQIKVPAGVSSFAINFATKDDLVVEGTETVELQLGSASATGLITDGAGTSLSINNITVNEASPTAVFRVDGVEGQEIKLNLEAYATDAEASNTDFTAGATAAELTGTSADIGSQLQVFDGKGWQNYTAGSHVTYPKGSTTLLVRVAVNNDTPFEGPESFKLIAEGRAIDSTASDDINTIRVAGIGIIADDARGSIYNNSGAENYSAIKDDDRSLKVSSININEASDHGIFTITQGGESAVTLNLALTDSNQRDLKTGENTFDMAQTIEVWSGSSWQSYSDSVTVNPNEAVYVRVNTSIEQDAVFEGSVGEQSLGETFRLTATPTGGGLAAFGVGQILDDGTGVIYTGSIGSDGKPVISTIGLDDDLDKDGIAPNVEEILASLSASSGGGGSVGDLNNDGVPDAEQSSVTTLAWQKAEYFEEALAGELDEIKPIISLIVENDTDPNTAGGSTDDKYQLQAVSVIQEEDVRFGGSQPTTTDVEGEVITAPWDPIVFSVAKAEGSTTLEDADLTREGVQVVVTIDIARSGIKEGEFNGYRKYVSADALANAAQPLQDLDGKVITTAGWYDFTQRQDESGNYVGDGARFIVQEVNGERLITKIQLTFTDNSFGDNSTNAVGIEDPGLPVRISRVAANTQTQSTTSTDTQNQVATERPNQAAEGGILELANFESPERPTSEPPGKVGEPSTYASVDNDAVITTTVVVDRGGEREETSLVQELAQEAQDTVMNWAASAGLTEGRAATNRNTPERAPRPDADPTDPNKPMAFVAEAMGIEPTLGSGLLEVLVLGGSALYGLDRFTGSQISQWVRRLLPATAAGFYAGAARYERVITVFLMESASGLPQVVAAKVTDEKIEILAEQILPMSLCAAAAPDQADLERELKQLVKKVTDQTNTTHDLLLFDPKLKEDLPIYDTLAKDNNELQPKSLHSVLSTLSADQLSDLRQWINKPASTDLSEHPIANRLHKRQKQLRSLVNDDKARLVSMLELSLAMSQRIA
ncbi:MAG: cadherin-like domain-containing protein, partial [Synechococcus sp. BS301-5m-G53]|nr:cadherin-like domain-containing protein [Synechococcus sp. BS301-5m-G53]